MSKNARLLALAAVVPFGPALAAGDNDTRTQSYTLGEIVVNGSGALGQTTQIVGKEEIRQKGARTLDEALRAVPGVMVSSGGQGIPRIMIRGLPPRETQIFLNGVPLNSAADGQLDPSLIPAEIIEEIKVIQGSSSVLYGPGTTAGVIDIITKRGTTGLHGDAGVEFGGGNAQRYWGDISGGGKNYDYFLAGSRTSRDAYLSPGGGDRANSDYARSSLFANIGADNGGWHFGAVGNAVVGGSQGLPPNTAVGNPFAGGQRYERLDSVTGQTGQFDLSFVPGGPFSMRATGYINELRLEDNRYDDDTYSSMTNPAVKTYHEIIKTTISGGQLQTIYDFGRAGSVTVSFAGRHEEEGLTGQIRDVAVAGSGAGSGTGAGTGGGGGNGTGGGTGMGSGGTFAVRSLGSTYELTTYSAAAEYRVDPFARTHVTLGYSHHWFERPGGLDQGDQVVPAISYDLTSNLQAFASFAQKVRFPTIDQLYDPQMGNTALRPERSQNVEGGFVFHPTDAARLTISGFRNDVKNFILNDQINMVFYNADVMITGAQATASYAVSERLTIQPGYTYLDTTYQDTGLPVDYRPRHVVNLQAVWVPIDTWTLSADATYTAGQSVGSKSDPTVRMALADYVTVNAKLQKSFPAVGLDAYVRCTNISDTRYDYAIGYPAAGRTVYGGVQYKF